MDELHNLALWKKLSQKRAGLDKDIPVMRTAYDDRSVPQYHYRRGVNFARITNNSLEKERKRDYEIKEENLIEKKMVF